MALALKYSQKMLSLRHNCPLTSMTHWGTTKDEIHILQVAVKNCSYRQFHIKWFIPVTLPLDPNVGTKSKGLVKP